MYNFIHPESNKLLEMDIKDKDFVLMYGKNGSGKTCFSKLNNFEKKYVFNDEFVNNNIYVVDKNGANSNADTKEGFSDLWIGEEIVKKRKILETVSEMKKEMQKKQEETFQKIYGEIIINTGGNQGIEKQLNIVKSEKIPFQKEETINEVYSDFNSSIKLETSIKSEEELLIQQKITKNNILLGNLISAIKDSEILNNIFLEENEYVSNFNSKIESFKTNLEEIKKIEDKLVKNNLNQSDKKILESFVELQKDRKSCVFCGFSENIESKYIEWKQFFEDKSLEIKNEIVKVLEAEIAKIKNIIDPKTKYEEIAPEIIEDIRIVLSKLEAILKQIINNQAQSVDFKELEKREMITDMNKVIENIINYIINKYIKDFSFFINYSSSVELEFVKIKEALKLELEKNAEKYAKDINDIFEALALKKIIKLVVDTHSPAKPKYDYDIEGHRKISELSDGEKRKLALSIFLSSIMKENLEGKTIVIDDPVQSLDVFGFYLLRDFIRNKLTRKFSSGENPTKLIITTHSINYLLVQISNLFEDLDMKDKTIIFKITPQKISEVPIDILNTDDITLFKQALMELSCIEELRSLRLIINKIFRLLLDIKLRINGISSFSNPSDEIIKLDISSKEKDKLQEISNYFSGDLRSDNVSSEQILNGLELLNEASSILGFEGYITDKIINQATKIVEDKIEKGKIDNPKFEMLNLISNVLEKKEEKYQNYQNYIMHSRNQITQTITALSLDEI